MTSRAVQYRCYGVPEVLELVERDTPRPGPGQVRLIVRAASVNPVDWKIRAGAMASGDAPDGPTVTGVDVAGVVDEVGAGVTDLAAGAEVLGRAAGGAFAEETVADAAALTVKPASLSWEAAAALPVAATTAYRALGVLGLGDGDHTGSTLVVDGASGAVGVIAVQLAVSRGVRVIGTASAAHQDDVRALGATAVVYGAGLVDRVRALAPDGADAAFDTAGKGSLSELVALTGSSDRVVTIADPSAGEHGVRFTTGGGGDEVAGALADAATKVADGWLRVPSITTYSLDKAVQAQSDNETGAVSGKLVVTM